MREVVVNQSNHQIFFFADIAVIIHIQSLSIFENVWFSFCQLTA